MGDRRRGHGRDRGRARPTPTSSWSGAGCTAPTSTARTSATLVGLDPVGVLATTEHRGDPRARRRLRRLQPAGARRGRGRAPCCAVGQERRDAGRLDLPRPGAQRARSLRRLPRGRYDAARHRHPPRRHHRAVPADGLGAVARASPTCASEEFSDIRTYGAPDVVRHIMALRRHARGGDGQPDGRPARRRLQAVGADDRRRDGLRRRPRDRDGAGGRRRHRADRLADRRHRARPGRRAAVPLARHRRRRPGRHRHRQLADGRGAPRPGVGASAPRASGSRSRSPATRRVKLTFKGLQPETHRGGAGPQPRASSSTANHCVSAIPYVVAAEPGIATYLDLPLIAGRAAPHLGHAPVILDRFRLDGKVAVVTGGGQGIGRGIAIGLAEAGADVVVGARTQADLDEVVARIEETGRRGLAVVDRRARRRGPRSGWSRRPWRRSGGSTCWSTTPAAPDRGRRWQTSEGFFELAMRFNVTQPFLMSQLAAQRDGRHRRLRRDRQHLLALGRHGAQLLRRRTAPARPRSTR